MRGSDSHCSQLIMYFRIWVQDVEGMLQGLEPAKSENNPAWHEVQVEAEEAPAEMGKRHTHSEVILNLLLNQNAELQVPFCHVCVLKQWELLNLDPDCRKLI